MKVFHPLFKCYFQLSSEVQILVKICQKVKFLTPDQCLVLMLVSKSHLLEIHQKGVTSRKSAVAIRRDSYSSDVCVGQQMLCVERTFCMGQQMIVHLFLGCK